MQHKTAIIFIYKAIWKNTSYGLVWAKCKNKRNIINHLAQFIEARVRLLPKNPISFFVEEQRLYCFIVSVKEKSWKIDKQTWIFYFLVGRTIWAFIIKATFWLANIAIIWGTIWQWWLPGITQSLISTRKTLRKERVDSYCISVSYLEMVSAVKGQDRNISICLGHNREEKCDVTLPW